MNAASHDGLYQWSNILIFHSPLKAQKQSSIISCEGKSFYIEYSVVTHGVTVPFPWKSVVHKSASVTTKCHGLVLQVTLSTLITYGAVQWMIHQQKFHHSLPGGNNMDWRNILESSCLYITLKPTAATRMSMLDLSAQDVPVLHIPNKLSYSNSTQSMSLFTCSSVGRVPFSWARFFMFKHSSNLNSGETTKEGACWL